MNNNNSNHTGRVTPVIVAQHIKNAESEQIAADIAAFKKRGGKIEKLGNTPLRPSKVSENRKTRQHRRPLEMKNEHQS